MLRDNGVEVTQEYAMVKQTYLKSKLRPGDVFFFMLSQEAKDDGVPDCAGIFSGQRLMTVMRSEGAIPKEQMTDVPYFVDDSFITVKRYTSGEE